MTNFPHLRRIYEYWKTVRAGNDLHPDGGGMTYLDYNKMAEEHLRLLDFIEQIMNKEKIND